MKQITLFIGLTFFIANSFAQRIMIEVGGLAVKNYTPGINAGITALLAVKKGSGVGLGMEVYKTNDLPLSLAPFIRGVLQSPKGALLNMQVGYQFMSEQYDDGKLNLGGMFAKLGGGFITKSKIYGLVNVFAGQVASEVRPGLGFVVGVKF